MDDFIKQIKELSKRVEELEKRKGDNEVGGISIYTSTSIPEGYLLCDGSSLLRASYPDLFAVIGTTFGSADGTHFNLPDLRGRVPVGKSSDTEFDTMGETGGEKTHTLSSAEMPSHTHTQDAHTHRSDSTSTADGNYLGIAGGGEGGWGLTNSSNNNIYRLELTSTTATNQNTGGGGAHNNLQPYITLVFIIKY